MLSLADVDVKIAGTTVLHTLSWELFDGAHWGIVGANGSGKSSFLGLIAGTLWPAPDKGKRRYGFNGRAQRDAVEARRRITLVGPELQDRYAKWGWNFSALDVVLSGVFKTDVPRKRADAAEQIRARAMMREFGLTKLAVLGIGVASPEVTVRIEVHCHLASTFYPQRSRNPAQ